MPVTIREHEVEPGLVIKFRQRLPFEQFQTEYAIQTYDDGHVTWSVPDGQGFGDDLEYMERKWLRVIEAVEIAMGVKVQ